MAKIKLTKNELKVQKDALKMYQRYLPTLTLKKQQLQTEIRTIEAKAKAVRKAREALDLGFRDWIAVFSEEGAFPAGIITSRYVPCARFISKISRLQCAKRNLGPL